MAKLIFVVTQFLEKQYRRNNMRGMLLLSDQFATAFNYTQLVKVKFGFAHLTQAICKTSLKSLGSELSTQCVKVTFQKKYKQQLLLTRWILALNVHTLEGGYWEGATDTVDTGT